MRDASLPLNDVTRLRQLLLVRLLLRRARPRQNVLLREELRLQREARRNVLLLRARPRSADSLRFWQGLQVLAVVLEEATLNGILDEDDPHADPDGLDGLDGDGRRFRKYKELLKRSLVPWPTDSSEFPIYFVSIDRLFEEHQIPEDLHVALVKSVMTRDVCKLLLTLPADSVDTWPNLKQALFDHFSLNSAKFRDLFWGASMRTNETYAQYQLRVMSYLNHYVSSREVTTLDDLKSLFVADKLKFTLKPNLLAEVNMQCVVSIFSAPALRPRRLGLRGARLMRRSAGRRRERCSARRSGTFS